jgi:hypothetical protein
MSDERQLPVLWQESRPETHAERLTRQFYEWERHGRGWEVFPYPVELEPPFTSFVGHYDPRQAPVDDGRKPTFLSSLAEGVRDAFAPSKPGPTISKIEPLRIEEPLPRLFIEQDRLAELRVALPRGASVDREAMERCLSAVGRASRPVSFEVVGLPGSTIVQLACSAKDLVRVQRQVQAFFPDASLQETEGFLMDLWEAGGARDSVIVDFGLSREFMLPIRTFKSFSLDPLITIGAAFEELEAHEAGIFQVLFQAVRNPWPESVLRAVTDWKGRCFFEDAPEMLSLAREKVSQPLFAAVIRVAVQSPRYGRAWELARSIGAGLLQFAVPKGNELIPLADDDYPADSHAADLVGRQTHRPGMILNAGELVGLAHLPSASVRSEKLMRETKRTKAAPAAASGHRLRLGENAHAGRMQVVTLSPEQRVRHTYVVGASGTGKSTLLLNLILQDIENGEGVGVLDPHGDLIEQILGYVPERRFSDVVLLDPADEAWPIGFNILSARSELEKNLLSSDLVAVFRRLSTSWGDQMTSVLGNAILAFLESERGGTLADLRRFLVEADFRRGLLETVKDSEVVYYWQKEFPLLTGKPQAPLLTRLDTFLRPKLIRYMVCQRENRLDFDAIMSRGKIFLAKLAQGAIGEENAHLLGALLVGKIHQLVMGRQELREAERRSFYLYIDEFQNFVTPTMASILSGARKYGLGLTLAHQELRQLWNRDTEVASAVMANPCTRVCFRLGDFDAQKLKEGFSFFDGQDLQNLGIGDAICRVERAEYDFNLRTFPLPAVDLAIARERRERIVELSRRSYGRKREEVEAELEKERASARPKGEPPAEEKAAEAVMAARPKPEEKKRAEPRVEAPEAEEPPRVRRAVPEAVEPLPPGRGGRQHRYLQELLKRLGESRGYRVSVEKQILGGAGIIDVALENEGERIACEISVTTTVEHEIQNMQKCLAAGFAYVVLVATERKALGKARELASEALGETDPSRVRFLTPEEFVSFLEELAAKAAAKEETVRGYKVKVKYKPVSEAEKKTRKQAITETIVSALRKMKGQSK